VVLASRWRQTPGTPADIAPLGGDGIVNFYDLKEFVADWLTIKLN
jgi:hypothetical protein